MLPFPEVDLERPDRLEDLFALANARGSQLLAGGTDLLPSLKHRLFRPAPLVSLLRIAELQGIREEDGGLSIGATETLGAVARDPRVGELYPALVDACRTIATRTIQSMGTLGGNVMLDTRCVFYNQPAGWRETLGGCLKADGSVCHVARTGTGCYAAQSADTVPVLWLLGAELELGSIRGVRRLAIRDLYGEDGRSWLKIERGEVLLRLHLPRPTGTVVHRKLRARGAIDYPLLLTAVTREGSGARAVLSALGPSPIEVFAERAQDLPEIAWKAARPLSTHLWPSTWRKHMVRVEVRRAIEALLPSVS
jgi:4-hydroxybenzoyl-CoA reductase subunit beta